MRRAIGPALLCAAVLPGCATKIDDAKGEQLIRKAVTEQVGVPVRSVDCPKGLTAKKGATFRCTVTGQDGTTGQARVTERDDKGHVAVDAPFLHVRDVERGVGAGLSRKVGAKVTVTCPQIVTVAKGGKFTCTARSGKSTADVAITQTDGAGHVHYELQRG